MNDDNHDNSNNDTQYTNNIYIYIYIYVHRINRETIVVNPSFVSQEMHAWQNLKPQGLEELFQT